MAVDRPAPRREKARLSWGRNVGGSVLLLATPILWLAIAALVTGSDGSAVASALVVAGLVLAVAFPITVVLWFHSGIGPGAAAVMTVIVVLAAVAVGAAVWSARLHFA